MEIIQIGHRKANVNKSRKAVKGDNIVVGDKILVVMDTDSDESHGTIILRNVTFNENITGKRSLLNSPIFINWIYEQ